MYILPGFRIIFPLNSKADRRVPLWDETYSTRHDRPFFAQIPQSRMPDKCITFRRTEQAHLTCMDSIVLLFLLLRGMIIHAHIESVHEHFDKILPRVIF